MSDQSVLLKIECTSPQNWFWLEWPCSWIKAAEFSRSGRPKRGNLERCGGENVHVCVRFGLSRLSWPEPAPLDKNRQMAATVELELWMRINLFINKINYRIILLKDATIILGKS